jgi:hypothetical protein
MKNILVILFTFFSIQLFGQTNQSTITVYDNGDTTVLFKWRNDLCPKINLERLSDTTTNNYFRLWTDKHVIDIWTDSENKLNGKITTWVKEYSQSKMPSQLGVHFTSNQLDSSQVKQINTLITELKIRSIVSLDSIPKWKNGIFGDTYIFEILDSTDYYFKTFWSPKMQKSIPEAKSINKFIEKVLLITNSSELWDECIGSVPFKKSTDGDMIYYKGSKRKKWILGGRKPKPEFWD